MQIEPNHCTRNIQKNIINIKLPGPCEKLQQFNAQA